MKDNLKIDFIGIAAAKSGTTWLANMLDKHPDICISEPKEVSYFNSEMSSNERLRHKNKQGPFINKNHTKPLSWYEKHFLHCRPENIIGEFSPVYFYDPEAPTAIKEQFPNAKLIVVLRNPIDRAYSEYWMFRNSFKIENRPFDEAIREKGTMHIQKGLYYKQLTRYLKYFDRNQICVVFFDDIRKNPEEMLKKVYGFLGVDDSFVPKNIRSKSNYAKASRIKGAVEFMNNTVKFLVQARMMFFVRVLRKMKINKLFLNLISKRVDYSPMELKTREYLRQVFEEDIRNFERLLNIDLSHWK